MLELIISEILLPIFFCVSFIAFIITCIVIIAVLANAVIKD